MSDVRLVLTTGFATGTEVADIQMLGDTVRTVEQVDNNDSLSVTVQLPWPTATMMRSFLRLYGRDGRQREYRIRQVQEDPDNDWAVIEAGGPWMDIGRSGLIRAVSNGTSVYSFGGQLTLSQWLTNYFVPNLATDDLAWISTTLGTLDRDPLVVLKWNRWNRMQLLQALSEELGMEPYLSQSAPGALYKIAFATVRGGTLPTFNVSPDNNLIRRQRSLPDTDIVTACSPFGDVPPGSEESATISENAWTTAIISTGWVSLDDPDGGGYAVGCDDMLNGKYLEIPTGAGNVRRLILDSRASDGGIQLADTSLLGAIGLRVRVVENSSGDPITVLKNPAAIARYGYVETPLDVSGERGERNWAFNATFNYGPAGFTAGTNGWNEPHSVTELGDLSCLANGTAAPASSSFAVDGLPPNSVIRKGSLMQVDGLPHSSTPPGSIGHTIDSTGKCKIGLLTSTAYAIADNQLLSLVSLNPDGVTYSQRTVVVDGAQAAGVGAVFLKGFETANRSRKFLLGDKIQFTYGGTYFTNPAGSFYLYNPSGAQANWTVSIPISATAFYSSVHLPHAPTPLSAGHPVIIRDYLGNVYNATVNGGHTYGGAFITLDVSVPPYTSFLYDAYFSQISIEFVQGSQYTVVNTAADAELNEFGVFTCNWAAGLPADYSLSRALWTDSADAPITYVDIIGGFGFGGTGTTTANFSHATRPQVPPNSTLANGGIANELLFCGATVVADNAGAVTIPLAFGNTNTIVDNTGVKLYRNTFSWPTPGNSRWALRIVNGTTTDQFAVQIRGSVPRQAYVTIHGMLWVPIGTNFFAAAPTTPVICTIYDALTNVVLGTVQADVSRPTENTARPAPVVFTAKIPFTLSTSRLVYIKITSTAAIHTNYLINLFINGIMVVVSDDPDVPLTPNSYANRLWLAGVRYLNANNIASPALTGTIVDLQQMLGAQLVAEGCAIGQSVYFEDFNVTQRAMSISINHNDLAMSDVSFDRLHKTLSALLAGE